MIFGGVGGGTVRLTDTFLENNDAHKIFPFALMHLDLLYVYSFVSFWKWFGSKEENGYTVDPTLSINGVF